jgi:hypothetical protein
MKRGDYGFATLTHKAQHAIAPFTRVKSKLVLQADHITRAVISHFSSKVVRARAIVIDNVSHTRVIVPNQGRLQNRRHAGQRLSRSPVHRVGRIFGKGR